MTRERNLHIYIDRYAICHLPAMEYMGTRTALEVQFDMSGNKVLGCKIYFRRFRRCGGGGGEEGERQRPHFDPLSSPSLMLAHFVQQVEESALEVHVVWLIIVLYSGYHLCNSVRTPFRLNASYWSRCREEGIVTNLCRGSVSPVSPPLLSPNQRSIRRTVINPS